VKKEGSVARMGEVKQAVWAEAHKGVDHKVVNKQKSDNECKRCGMKNHAWKDCGKPVQESAVYRLRAKPQRQASFAPRGRPQVATVVTDAQGEGSRQAVPRPPAWAFEVDDI